MILDAVGAADFQSHEMKASYTQRGSRIAADYHFHALEMMQPDSKLLEFEL
jgi:hypothetical protein